MQEELLHLLKSNKIFSGIPEAKLNSLNSKFTELVLEKNEILFQQGDSPDFVYLLASGRLLLYLQLAENKTKIVDYVEAGQILGELSALGGNPRPLSTKALTRSVLYRISNKDFIHLCYRYPQVMFASVHPLMTRVEQIVHTLSDKKIQDIAIFPANIKTNLEKFSTELIALIKDSPHLLLISDFSPEFDETQYSIDTLKEKIRALKRNKKPSQQVIYLLKSHDNTLTKIALEKAQVFYIVANAEHTPHIDKRFLELLSHKKKSSRNFQHLVLIHPEETVMPQNTAPWLNIHHFNMHHHIKINELRHYKRLLRFIRGRAYGLVLGGGGTRGFAHLGALKAIRESKIPIDFIGGTSVGAMIGACYAMKESLQETTELFHKIVDASRKTVSWVSITLPIVSLFDGKLFTNALQDTFKDIRIENLWLPFFCVSTNLANYSEEIHCFGSAFEKTRASASLPGIVPPMLIDGEIHYDGGLLNNLPVDIMRQYLGEKAKIIAIELTSSMHDFRKYEFPPILTFKKTLLLKLGFSRENYIFPRFVDSFIRGLLVGSSVRATQNGALATLLIDLSLRKFPLLRANKKQAAKMLEIGYLETLKKIYQYKNKNV